MKTNPIPLTPVESGLIAAIGHQDGTLAVQFKNGNTYHYPADADTFTRFLSADSKGTHFARYIRPIGHSHKFEVQKA
jgi:hypothetical protein